MFEATLNDPQIFKKLIESLNALVTEVNIEVTSDSLSLQAMDSAHVSLVSLKINEVAFEKFRCDKSLTLGLNLVDFGKVLKMAKSDDTMTLTASEENAFLSIKYENKETQKIAEFQLNLLTLENQALGIPDAQYPTTIKMSSLEFVSLCKDFSGFTDCVKIDVRGDVVTFIIAGKAGKGKYTIKNNESEKVDFQVSINSTEDVCCSYGLQYLNSFAKASSLSNQVTLNISKKYPLMIDYEIKDFGFLKFFLAPKMDDDEGNAEEDSKY